MPGNCSSLLAQYVLSSWKQKHKLSPWQLNIRVAVNKQPIFLPKVPPCIYLLLGWVTSVLIWISSVQHPYAKVFIPHYSSSFAFGFCLRVHFSGFRFFPNFAGKCYTIDIPRREKHGQFAKKQLYNRRLFLQLRKTSVKSKLVGNEITRLFFNPKVMNSSFQ